MTKDAAFAGSIPELYDRHLGYWLFAPYAADLARRLTALLPTRVLETAADTGIVTRALLAALPDAAIVATDLNQAMLDHAAKQTGARNVTWRQADAQALPFADGEFDAVVCQFGAMFFPDRPRAFAEARRVLRAGGRFVFSVWDRIDDNELAHLVTEALAARFPDDPPRFLPRTPYGHFDRGVYRRALADAGFGEVDVETVTLRGRASARDAAIGLCQGCPLAAEIEGRAPGALAATTDEVAAAITARLGAGVLDSKMQAFVFTAA